MRRIPVLNSIESHKSGFLCRFYGIRAEKRIPDLEELKCGMGTLNFYYLLK